MPRIPRTGPTSGLPSGLNVKGPFTKRWMPALPTAGKWAKPRSSSGAMRSRSWSSSWNTNSHGVSFGDHGRLFCS